MLFLFFKWIHILAIISWMAGVLYLFRLHINIVENSAAVDVRKVLLGMADRLYRLITVPAMTVAYIVGFAMVFVLPSIASGGWFHVKLLLVFILSVFTVFANRITLRIRNKAEDVPSSTRLRVYNEVPTLLMLVIIACVIFKPF